MKIRQLVAGISFLALANIAFAGFDEGLIAAKRGDFKTAFSVWHPLAEQGDSNAQFNLGLMYGKGHERAP